MTIALIQYQSSRGNIIENIDRHATWINQAHKLNADLVVFPELSLSGYEPNLSKSLALSIEDHRIQVFQTLSDRYDMIIAVGAPIQAKHGVSIGMFIFKPKANPASYFKTYLHSDELPFFISGKNQTTLLHDQISLAICYEISVPEHLTKALQEGAKIYIASVAKHEKGIIQARELLANIAKEHEISVLLVNGIGPSDDYTSFGSSSIWDETGTCIKQLSSVEEGILIFES